MSDALSNLKLLPTRNTALRNLFIALVALVAATIFTTNYYLALKKGLFDDVYIYLAMARNAIDYGTWQYHPGVVEREALLASSPLRLVVLTLAAALSKAIGFGGRELLDAKVTLLLSGGVSALVFAPFWRGQQWVLALITCFLMLMATCFDSVLEFEGALLLLWTSTLVMLRTKPAQWKRLGWLLPLGPLIRPDLTLPIAVLLFGNAIYEQDGLRNYARSVWLPALVIIISWCLLATLMGVYPIPVTYWGKASIPEMFENTTLLRELPNRLGATLLGKFESSEAVDLAIGSFSLALAAIVLMYYKGARWVTLIALVIACILVFFRMPANFWWYYQNILLILLGALLAVALVSRSKTGRLAQTLFLIYAFAIMLSRFPTDGPGQWRTGEQSRAQGYLSLATAATAYGTFKLDGVGEFILKNPEIGMITYFAKQPVFQWDSAGLAQPLDNPKVLESKMRYFYPHELQRTAHYDAQRIVNRVGRPLPVLEVWAMEDRNYEAARRSCKWVVSTKALCINEFTVVKPI